jgi:hypothetical protein
MKRLIHKTHTLLRSSRGETILETVVALLILTILMTSVTMIVRTAVTITRMSIDSSERNQTLNNDLVGDAASVEDAEGNTVAASTGDFTITISSIDADPSTSAVEPLEAEHEVNYISVGGFTVFSPKT